MTFVSIINEVHCFLTRIELAEIDMIAINLLAGVLKREWLSAGVFSYHVGYRWTESMGGKTEGTYMDKWLAWNIGQPSLVYMERMVYWRCFILLKWCQKEIMSSMHSKEVVCRGECFLQTVPSKGAGELRVQGKSEDTANRLDCWVVSSQLLRNKSSAASSSKATIESHQSCGIHQVHVKRRYICWLTCLTVQRAFHSVARNWTLMELFFLKVNQQVELMHAPCVAEREAMYWVSWASRTAKVDSPWNVCNEKMYAVVSTYDCSCNSLGIVCCRAAVVWNDQDAIGWACKMLNALELLAALSLCLRRLSIHIRLWYTRLAWSKESGALGITRLLKPIEFGIRAAAWDRCVFFAK